MRNPEERPMKEKLEFPIREATENARFKAAQDHDIPLMTNAIMT